jgi:hypothetical protein
MEVIVLLDKSGRIGDAFAPNPSALNQAHLNSNRSTASPLHPHAITESRRNMLPACQQLQLTPE